MIIGSHVSCSGSEMLVGSVKEALSYGSNAFMFYTGAPQNTSRKAISEFNLDLAMELISESEIDFNNVVVHAPYIINLANTTKPNTFELAVSFLKEEIIRCESLGIKHLVLHPGSHVGAGEEVGIERIIEGLNLVLRADQSVKIAIETMSGKGTECGYKFEHIAQIFAGVTYSDKLEVCLDTCHINDAGYDIVSDLDGVLEEFDRIIGLQHLAVIHLNDSKNILGAKKDRHENIGFGNIGFDTLVKVATHEKLKDVPKFLETPYVSLPEDKKKTFAPYKHEIEMLKSGIFNENVLEEILNSK